MSITQDGSRTHSQTKDPPVTSQFAEIREQLAIINQRLSELGDLKILVNSLKEQNEAKDRKITHLQQCVEDLEQYTMQDDIIISGLKTKHKSYARATVSFELTDRQNPPYDELDSLEEQVTTFLNDKMGITLSDTDVSICHTHPGKKDSPNIVVRLTSRRIKTRILK